MNLSSSQGAENTKVISGWGTGETGSNQRNFCDLIFRIQLRYQPEMMKENHGIKQCLFMFFRGNNTGGIPHPGRYKDCEQRKVLHFRPLDARD
ncbi:hypothetical protein [Shigella sonnei]|uniref:hypothetical protein n=1 Tax=Shigella sonnei TaxID=624 RepID=UPI0024054EB8|nr:hypothetical protein [Shigella sonnei]